MPARRATILDVAALAGVHAGTVSRALSEPDRVAPATRARIEAAVTKLGFVPNRAARGLITGRTGMAAIIVPDITNPHFAALVRSIERAVRDADLQVLLVDTGEVPDDEVAAARSLARDVDGFIVVSPRRLHRALDALDSKPAVFVNRPVRDHGSVLLRTAPAMAEALHHLAGLGHQKLAYLVGPTASWAATERRDAVRRTSRAIGIETVEIATKSPTFEATVDVAEALVASGASAVAAFNDQMALGTIAGLNRLGLSVPSDVSVVGCDDVPMAAMVAPALTTIGMPTDVAGGIAVSILRGLSGSQELASSFVVRGSTGPVRRRRATASATEKRRPSASARG